MHEVSHRKLNVASRYPQSPPFHSKLPRFRSRVRPKLCMRGPSCIIIMYCTWSIDSRAVKGLHTGLQKHAPVFRILLPMSLRHEDDAHSGTGTAECPRNPNSHKRPDLPDGVGCHKGTSASKAHQSSTTSLGLTICEYSTIMHSYISLYCQLFLVGTFLEFLLTARTSRINLETVPSLGVLFWREGVRCGRCVACVLAYLPGSGSSLPTPSQSTCEIQSAVLRSSRHE